MRLEPVNPELDLLAKRFTETLPPFVPLPAPRVPGSWEHRIPPPPADFFDPLSSDELRNWYGET